MTRTRIAIVVQRYGKDVLGGAEDAARLLAEQLTAVAEVHVITTCATEYTTWANVYPSGVAETNGVTVHRFPVDGPRDWKMSLKNTGLFWLEDHSLQEQIDWIRENGPFSTPLFQFIKQSENDFATFIFFTYVYATTFFGVPIVAGKAVLVPTAHDEPFLYSEAYRILLNMPSHIVYLTEGERDMTQWVTGNGRIPSTIAAIGLTRPEEVSPERFRQKYGVTGDFLLYGGRLTLMKNVPQLVDYFQKFRQENGRDLKLVLMGDGDFQLPTHPDIIPIGFVPEQDKFDALSAATIVVQPSQYESLSLIILQAWLVDTPVLVNSRCAVTKQQCRLSDGGLYYDTFEEFTAVLNVLLADPQLRATLAAQGRRFTTTTYNWEAIIARYQAIFQQLKNR